MDAPSGPVDPVAADELRRLRQRAYGPGSDIEKDATAQARLAELEAAQRQPATPTVDAVGPLLDPIPERTRPAESVRGPTNGADKDAKARRGLPWGIAVGAVLVAVVAIGILLVNELSEPQPVVSLVAQAGPVDEVLPIEQGIAQEWGVIDADFVSHGSYGAAQIWTTTTPEGKQCLAVVMRGSTWRFSCTAPTIDTVADIDIDSDLVPPAPSGEPTWNIRFVLHAGVVDVYLAPKPEGGFF